MKPPEMNLSVRPIGLAAKKKPSLEFRLGFGNEFRLCLSRGRFHLKFHTAVYGARPGRVLLD